MLLMRVVKWPLLEEKLRRSLRRTSEGLEVAIVVMAAGITEVFICILGVRGASHVSRGHSTSWL